jgi:hypothetical protein
VEEQLGVGLRALDEAESFGFIPAHHGALFCHDGYSSRIAEDYLGLPWEP